MKNPKASRFSISIIIALLSLCAISVTAQKNVIKLPATVGITDVYSLAYERMITNQLSLTSEFQHWNIKNYHRENSKKTTRYYNDGNRYQAQLRWYPNQTQSTPRGFYSGLSLFAGKHNIRYRKTYEFDKPTDTHVNTGSELLDLGLFLLLNHGEIKTGETSASVFSYGGSIEAGYQFFLFNFLSLGVSGNYQVSKGSKHTMTIEFDEEDRAFQNIDNAIDGNKFSVNCSIGVFF